MIHQTFRSKPLIAAVLIVFVALLAREGYAQIDTQAPNEFARAFQAGKKLYEDGEHKEAVIKFFQALTTAKEKSEIVEASFYLSLSYYGLGDSDSTQLYMKKMFEAQPEREIDARLFPAGYIILFYRLKSELAKPQPDRLEAKPKEQAKAKEEEGKPVAMGGKTEAASLSKKGKFPWLLVGGLVVVAGIVLYLILSKKSGSTQGAAAGAINVTAPAAGSLLYKESTCEIKWSSTVSGNVKIELVKGTTLIETIAGDTLNDGAQSWPVSGTLVNGSDYRIRISIVANPTVLGESGYFQIGDEASYEFVARWGSQGGGDGQFNGPRGVAVDNSGYVYVADADNNRIQKFTGSGSLVSKWGSYGTGDGQFAQPSGVAVDNAGFVYVLDSGNNRVQKFTLTGSFVAKFGGAGSGDGQFNGARWLAVGAFGNVFVSDQFNYRIQKFDSNGVFLTKWGSRGNAPGQFNTSQGVVSDATGNVYVAEAENKRIQKFNSDGTFLIKWGGNGPWDGFFGTLEGLAIDNAACIYAVDYAQNRIQKFDSNGTFISKWGLPGAGDGQFMNPSGIAVDNSGNIYVAEIGNNRIQKFRPRQAASPRIDPPLRAAVPDFWPARQVDGP